MAELKYGGSDVSKIMYKNVQVASNKVYTLFNKNIVSMENNFKPGITKQQLIDGGYTTLIASFIDWTSSSPFWKLNLSVKVGDFLKNEKIILNDDEKFAKLTLIFIDDEVCLQFGTLGNRNLNLAISVI